MIKNKRGDIPITILVLGVILICILTVLSFSIVSVRVQKNFDVTAVKEAKLTHEKISLYANLGFSQEEISRLIPTDRDSLGRYITEERQSMTVRYYIP